MTTTPDIALPDTELIDRARTGDVEAFGELWNRHYAAALRVARAFAPRPSDAEAMVAEAHAMIFQRLLDGRLSSAVFRPWLYTIIRHIADPEHVEAPEDRTEPVPDPGPSGFTARAFQRLPDRWRSVLWYTRVERMDYAQVAPILGMSTTGVAALAARAEEGFQSAWLQAHVVEAGLDAECRWALLRLGRDSREALDDDDKMRLELHLLGCDRCPIVSDELGEMSTHLALVMLPLTLGAIVGGTILAQLSAGAASAATAIPALPASVVAVAAHHAAAASAASASVASAASAGATVAAASGSAAATGSAGFSGLLLPGLIGGAVAVAAVGGLVVFTAPTSAHTTLTSSHSVSAGSHSSGASTRSTKGASAPSASPSASSTDAPSASASPDPSATDAAGTPSDSATADPSVAAGATSGTDSGTDSSTAATSDATGSGSGSDDSSSASATTTTTTAVAAPTTTTSPTISAPTSSSTPTASTPTPATTPTTTTPAPTTTSTPAPTTTASAAPAAPATRTVDLAGTATPRTQLTVSSAGTVLGTTTVAANGRWSIALASVPTSVTSVSVTQSARSILGKLITVFVPVRVTTTGGLRIL